MELVFYRNGELSSLLEEVLHLYDAAVKAPSSGQGLASGQEKETYYRIVGEIYDVAIRNGFQGNLWQCLLTEKLVYDENPFTMAAERRSSVAEGLRYAVMHDLSLFYAWFSLDLEKIDAYCGGDAFTGILDFKGSKIEGLKYNPVMTKELNRLAVTLSKASDVEVFAGILEEFYRTYGVGVFGLHKAFRVDRKEDGKGILTIDPIYNIAVTSLDDLVGYETQKKKLVENTESFLAGKKANNCLLYGESGTGKSSSIRAILNTYYIQGLRMIEVYKHQYRELNDLIDRLKTRNYKFIIYLDDLSFEEFETDYKYLKAVIEGGLESKPDNVLIYATSNRRHLVREYHSDRADDEKNKSETVQEKLSLYARFGVSVYYPAPEEREFFEIVKELAHRRSLAISDEELVAGARKWALSHSGWSGRTATQFVDHLCGK